MREHARTVRWWIVVFLFLCAASVATALPPETEKLLSEAQYVYIATQRKDGSFGSKAEIWFFHHDGAVWVGTAPESWRVRRIRAGRPSAKIHVGKPDGPSFDAVGSIVKDENAEKAMFDTYAKKYPDGWPRHEERFRQGFKNGTRVMIRYEPKSDGGEG